MELRLKDFFLSNSRKKTMEAQLANLFSLRTASENIMWIDGVYVNRDEKGMMVSINTNDFEMSATWIGETFENIHIRKLKSKGKYGKKETDYLQARGYRIEREFATRKNM